MGKYSNMRKKELRIKETIHYKKPSTRKTDEEINSKIVYKDSSNKTKRIKR